MPSRTRPTPSAEAPARLGPRPLGLHLGLAISAGVGAIAALPAVRSGLLPWPPDLATEAAALGRRLAEVDLASLSAALVRVQGRRLQEVLQGIQAYHAHPFRRDLAPPPVLWREGTTRLLDYGGTGPVAALFVPSLINRYYVLDLTADQSLARWLAQRGVRVLVLDWDAPGKIEAGFDLDDYIAGRLERAVEQAIATVGGPLALVGYCLGGNLALAAALRRQSDLAGLALLATPWDFHAGSAGQAGLLALVEGHLDILLRAFGELPVDVLQLLFTWLDPQLAPRKFRRFAAMPPESAAARGFVALEDWLNDGVPLAPKVARQCLVEWYGRNLPMQGAWTVLGRPIRPAKLRLPAFLAIPGNDRIVPPASALALAQTLPAAKVVRPRAGHIGMVVGQGGRRGLWQPLGDWLAALAK